MPTTMPVQPSNSVAGYMRMAKYFLGLSDVEKQSGHCFSPEAFKEKLK
jgi:hypothetical protein